MHLRAVGAGMRLVKFRLQFHGLTFDRLWLRSVSLLAISAVIGGAHAENLAVPDIVVDADGARASQGAAQAAPAESVQDSKEGSAESGYRARTINVGPLGKQAVQDTPLSINSVSSELIENLGASSTSEAMRYNPTVRPQLGSNLSANYFMIRGFSYSSNGAAAVDGMRSSVGIEPIEDKERVEILNGASAFLYGFTGPGGIVNYVLKRPTDTTINKIRVGNYGGQQGYVQGDFSGPLTLGEGQFGYRFNFVKVGNGNVGIDRETHPRQLYSGAFDWHVTPSATLSLEASHFDRDIKNQQAYFLVGSATKIPSAPDLNRNYGAPYNFTHDEYNRVGASLNWKVNEVFTVRSAFRYTASENRSINMRDSLINNVGDYNYYMQIKSTNQALTTQGYTFVDANFVTGSIRHDVTFGYAQTYVESRNAYPNSDTNKWGFPTSMIGSILNPTYPADPNVALNTGHTTRATEKTQLISALAADRVTFNDQWSIFLGANAPRVEDTTWVANTGALTAQYAATRITPSGAVLFKPLPNITTYVAYTQSLLQGPTAPSTSINYGQALPPYLATQWETGVKTTVGRVDLNLAFFDIEKANAYTDPVTTLYTLDGRERHRGAEFTFTGKMTDQITLGGGFTVLDAIVTKSSTASLVGKTPLGVPNRIANVFGEYAVDCAPGLFLLGGATYTSKEWVNSANTISIPQVFLLDTGARYEMKVGGKPTTFRVNVSNLLDTRYWTNKGDDMLYTGDPRTVSFSMTMNF
ncbi:iron complex outermembrane receptor protein [Rhodoblastus acidophilus]|uniref:TonB-dependent receptor n=1 Tax=Rhodoblastus acidophilus TaxID=1074 RepID=UPI002224C7D3|nr:TonB-dependent receptor [Rhodoblastus acidophilus]MCW2319138.1 iron complex outermembrane receptor protein [Rhodoblastus acidophilus]